MTGTGTPNDSRAPRRTGRIRVVQSSILKGSRLRDRRVPGLGRARVLKEKGHTRTRRLRSRVEPLPVEGWVGVLQLVTVAFVAMDAHGDVRSGDRDLVQCWFWDGTIRHRVMTAGDNAFTTSITPQETDKTKYRPYRGSSLCNRTVGLRLRGPCNGSIISSFYNLSSHSPSRRLAWRTTRGLTGRRWLPGTTRSSGPWIWMRR